MAFRIVRSSLVALVTICLGHEYAAAQWGWRNPLPQGNSLTDIQAFSASLCYAAGQSGTFLTTTSGGDAWRLVSLQDMPNISSLLFTNQTTGILLGSNNSVNYLFRTTDAGSHWVTLHPPGGMANAAFFLTEDTGWAATTGALQFTFDGGTSWVARKLPGAGVTRLFFLDHLAGWALTQDTVFRTVDGGASWLGSIPDSLVGWGRILNKIVFVTPQVGWLSVTTEGPNHYSGHIFKSTDGGNKWVEQLTIGEDFFLYTTFSDIDMRDELIGWADALGRIFKTEDGGKNWKQIATVPDLNQLSFANENQLWGCGSYGALYSSSDGGVHWTPKQQGVIASLNDLYWLDRRTGFAAGDTLLMKSHDAGATWEPVPVHFPDQDYGDVQAVWFADSLRGWIGVERTGGWGSLLLTTNGGQSWQAQLDSVNRIFSLFFIGKNFGWASSGNKVYRTTDSGATWHAGGTSANPGEIESLFFTSRDSGWAGGYLGLARTTDGGASWTTVLPDGMAGLFVKGIHFLNPQSGWIVGYSGNDGYIFKTEDGGNIWRSQAHPTVSMYTWLMGVTFVDENHGWVVGQSYTGGIAFRTTDGGTHWEEDGVPLDRPMLRVRSTGPEVWILGDHAAILHHSATGPTNVDQSDEPHSPASFRLEQNYPNPFNPKTGIRYSVPAQSGRDGQVSGVSDVKLVVYDLLGREVAVLVNEKKTPGTYQIIFDGSGLASGLYFYRLTAGESVQTRSMMLVK